MIEIHERFRIHPEYMQQAKEAARKQHMFGMEYGIKLKTLTDLATDFYTLVFVIEVNSFDEYLDLSSRIHATEEWKEWYKKFRACIVEGKRELYTIEQ